MKIRVERVVSRRDLRRFIALPYALHRDDPLWIPPLRSEIAKVLSPGNPFYAHAEQVNFLAKDGDTSVGRIAAIVDRNHIRFHGERVGFWGFFESIRDTEVAGALFTAAEEWLTGMGMVTARGPMNPSTNDECGLLVDGFDTPPKLMMTHNPPWYAEMVEACGYDKVKDLLAFHTEITSGPIERLARLAGRVEKREPGLLVRPVNLRDFHREIDCVLDIYNSAWEKNWGFVPMDEEEVRAMARRLKPLVVPDLLQLAFVEGDPAGFIMTLPDYNEALAGLSGRLTPLNLLRIFMRSRRISSLRVFTMGIKPKYRTRGIDAVIYYRSLLAASRAGYRTAEFSWILEDNVLIQAVARLMGAEPYKRYRIYEKTLREAA